MKLVVALLVVLCACARSDDDVTLRFWALGREGQVVQQLIPEFERRNPGVRVQVQQIPWTAAHEKLLTAYVGNATPHVAQIGNTWVPEFVALNALLPLDSVIAASPTVPPDDYFPGIWDTNVIDGSVYGLPWYVDTRVLFYRSDILRQAGYAAVPATWTEWREAMRAIKRDVGPDRYAILLPTNEWPQPVLLGLQNGSPLLRDDGRYGGFRDPRFREAFSFYVDLYREGLAPAVSSNQVANLYEEFARGLFAMYITGPWNVSEFSRRLPAAMEGRWATAPMPGPRAGEPGVSLAGGSSLVLFAGRGQDELAWRLIEYLSEPAQQIRFYELTNNLPARESAWQATGLADDRYTRAFYQQLHHVVATPKVPEWEEIATRTFEAVEEAVRSRRSVDEVLARLDRDVDRMLEKRRWMLARRARRDSTASDPPPAPPMIGAERP